MHAHICHCIIMIKLMYSLRVQSNKVLKAFGNAKTVRYKRELSFYFVENYSIFEPIVLQHPHLSKFESLCK